jgi:hypothetical protein
MPSSSTPSAPAALRGPALRTALGWPESAEDAQDSPVAPPASGTEDAQSSPQGPEEAGLESAPPAALRPRQLKTKLEGLGLLEH